MKHCYIEKTRGFHGAWVAWDINPTSSVPWLWHDKSKEKLIEEMESRGYSIVEKPTTRM